ncbi:(ZYRO0B15048g) [Zygosaccharomyces parabailii]|nr:(ZYRO0B15048g) [Zygosaccharomyces parabailii]
MMDIIEPQDIKESSSVTPRESVEKNATSVEFHNVGSHIRSVTSRRAGEVNYINAATSNSDNQLLAEIGYKQELQRKFSTLQVFGVAFSIMGLLPSIGTVLSTGLAGGPVSAVWGWLIAGCLILMVGLAMAENSSAIPTAGGLYYWTYYYAPVGYKEVLSFIIGCTNSLALTAACCSISYGFAEEVLSAVILSKDGDFTVTHEW